MNYFPNIIATGSDVEGLIWLVIIVVSIVGQIISNARKAIKNSPKPGTTPQKPSRPAEAQRERAVNDNAFLRKPSGSEEDHRNRSVEHTSFTRKTSTQQLAAEQLKRERDQQESLSQQRRHARQQQAEQMQTSLDQAPARRDLDRVSQSDAAEELRQFLESVAGAAKAPQRAVAGPRPSTVTATASPLQTRQTATPDVWQIPSVAGFASVANVHVESYYGTSSDAARSIPLRNRRNLRKLLRGRSSLHALIIAKEVLGPPKIAVPPTNNGPAYFR